MSILNMESWMIFGRHSGDDSGSAANTAMRAAMASALTMAGYQIYRDTADCAFIIRSHPIYPDRNALVFSAVAAQIAQFAIRKRAGDNASTLIGGFSLFIPSSFVPSVDGNSVNPAMAVLTGAIGSGLNKMTGNGSALVTDEVFRIRCDLKIGYGAEVQNTKAIAPGRIAFLEYRITQSEIRVWLDDTLVLQKNVALNNSTIQISVIPWLSALSSASGQWAVADWYNLKEDAITPNTRLGPSTRVIGVRPDTDTTAQFTRPAGYASNAAVVAQPFNPDSTAFVKTDAIGARDIYTGTEDLATATAVLVHAQSVKIIAKNVDTSVHTVSPLLVSEGVQHGAPIVLPTTLGPLISMSSVDPATGAAWTPAAASISKFGMKLET